MKYVIGLISLLLAGCAGGVTTPVAPSPSVIVHVPVIQPWPQPHVIVKPKLPINSLTPDQTKSPDQVTKALDTSYRLLMNYSSQLNTALNAYRTTNSATLKRRIKNSKSTYKKSMKHRIK